jgi:hypothetical protein
MAAEGLFANLLPPAYLTAAGAGLVVAIMAILVQRSVRMWRDQQRLTRHRERVSRLEARLAQGACLDV